MAVVLLEADPFQEALASNTENMGFKDTNVRRPLLGMLPKKPRFAFVSIYTSVGDEPLVPLSVQDSSAPDGFSYANHNFLLQSVTHQRQERSQIVETFGAPYIFFYGSQVETLAVQGLLLNTSDFNWKNEWLQNYEKYLRGTKCVEYKARVYLGFDDVLVEGYIVNTTLSYSAEMPVLCPFNFSMIITGYQDLSASFDPVTQAQETRQLEDREDVYLEHLSDLEQSPIVAFDESGGLTYTGTGVSEPTSITRGEVYHSVSSEDLWGEGSEAEVAAAFSTSGISNKSIVVP